jgi:hypothetical protein
MTRVATIFRRPSEGRADNKKIERSIDRTREYCDLWGGGTLQLEKNIESGCTNLYVHGENGSKKFKLTNTVTWFDKVAAFVPYEETIDDNYKLIHLADNDGIYLVISKKATEVVFNCD